ncbi:cysteine desulfurase-like protein [Thalassoroseus pseudoceratinae]|uniref:cysteine desulfurase-like protein n=1 Tax=Thalassoroseus pseudoceratinae TaxID=2713176 RepID=UPI001422385E|nr:cysteine desulfurase-like protein [Thalassoroseus pseudoceratinae]
MGLASLAEVRQQFPALTREVNGQLVAHFDGPAGSQVPQRVADAVSSYLLERNANRGAPFATSRESDALLDDAHKVLAAFLGATDPGTIAFGANMTTLTMHLSRALSRTWQAGDEVLVTQLDHDANVTPWVLAARDAGAKVKAIRVRPEDCTLDLEDFRQKLSAKTRLVAVGYASNAVGTINPLPAMVRDAHAVDAEVFVDAVHYAPHGLIDVTALDCDFLAVSAYKFFGPHVGVLYGKRNRLEELQPYKLRPAPNSLPGRWMTGTQSHEGIAGAAEAVRYLEWLGQNVLSVSGSRREILAEAMQQISLSEQELCTKLLAGLGDLPRVRIWGITDLSRMSERVPTVSITHESLTPHEMATQLAERGLFCWPGNHYALPVTEALGLEPHGTLRIGILHYNTGEEIERLLAALAEIV